MVGIYIFSIAVSVVRLLLMWFYIEKYVNKSTVMKHDKDNCFIRSILYSRCVLLICKFLAKKDAHLWRFLN
jgi:hypothetical protein